MANEAETRDGSVTVRSLRLQGPQANSVGFYQITKLLIIPTVMGLERLQGRKSAVYSRKVILSIVVTAIGVAVATVSDFEMNVRGTILAALSIVSTAQYQIWQGSKQHEHGVTATQITYSVAWPQSIAGLASSLTADVLMPQLKVLILMRPSCLLEHQLSGQGDLFWIALCNVLAVCTNISVYGLIGKTSPVTYQVVGQLKTVLVVVFGYIFFDVRVPLHWLMLRFAGVGVAVVGVFSYALCKSAEGREKTS
ncbi:putative membrane protein [Symbiodinium microadriaticum]|uniref:Putative membrane protein n=1 Tax=Symbiodinium microadriaticum TaxID=2951 RepID=A0A1Q9E636_SYMMI|nr:putative membrane protein [Symbiodinium microadriaticum]